MTFDAADGQNTKLIEVPSWQAWYKPLPDHGAAIFVANHGSSSVAVRIDFNTVPGLGPPPPAAHCDSQAFPVDLGDSQCMGLRGPVSTNGVLVKSAEDCCAACTAAGAACDTWGFCPASAPCARLDPPHGAGTPGCFTGKSTNCPNRTNGWVAWRRVNGSTPPQPPPPPTPPSQKKLFAVFDIWAQEQVSGKHSSYSIPSLASHDSIFLTVKPA